MTVTDLPAPPNQPPADTDALIAWGTAHQSSRMQALAGKAHRALIDLRQAAERESKVAAAEARIDRLEAQLANARRDLAAAKGTPRPGARPSSGERPGREELGAIREWARENGYQVGAAGVIRREIVDAYRAAHADHQAA